MTYKGNTYGIPTDGNVHIQYVRKDLLENPDNQKRFADKHGKKLEFPQTWEDDFQIQQFLNDPEKDLYGSGSLRNRANGPTWWYMMFYSAGGLPVRRRHEPDAQHAGRAIRGRDLSAGEEGRRIRNPAGWGTPQMIPRIASGKVVSCQYWDGTAKLNENKEKSQTVGKWLYGLVPGSDKSGKRIHRSISSPLAALLINKYSPRKAQAAYLALWLGDAARTRRRSCPTRSTPSTTPGHKGHMTAPTVIKNYTPAGIKAIEQNLQVVSPPVYLTGYLEFQDLLGKNLSEAYVGQLPARTCLSERPRTSGTAIVDRIGRASSRKSSRATRR